MASSRPSKSRFTRPQVAPTRVKAKVVPVDGQVLDQVVADQVQPALLLRRERPARVHPGHGPVHPLLGRERGAPNGGVLDDGDGVGQFVLIGGGAAGGVRQGGVVQERRADEGWGGQRADAGGSGGPHR